MVERLTVILHLFGSRGLPTFLFAMMAFLGGAAAVRAPGPADAIFHLLSAALWVMFAVLVNVRPAPLRRGRSVIGVAAALGIALGAQRWAPALGAWLVCLGLQLVRTAYEERSLRAEFPEYAPYAERTKRLIPGLV